MSRRVKKNLFTSTLIVTIAVVAVFIYLGARTLLRAQEAEDDEGNVVSPTASSGGTRSPAKSTLSSQYH